MFVFSLQNSDSLKGCLMFIGNAVAAAECDTSHGGPGVMGEETHPSLNTGQVCCISKHC